METIITKDLKLDLDIDSVTLCTYSINKSGQLDLWSPYSRTDTKENLEKSMHLPLPTGNEVKIKENASLQEVVSFLDKFGKMFKFDTNKRYFTFNSDLDFLNELLQTVVIPQLNITDLNNFSQYVKNNFGIDIVNFEQAKFIFDSIKQTIDNHNLYLEGKRQEKLLSIMNNYNQQQMYDIISDPVNQKAAQLSVDEVTDPIKEIAANKGYSVAFDNSRRTSGNSIAKYESINDAQEGKDCIARAASCLKGFFATLQYYNSSINDPNAKQHRLLGRKMSTKKGEEYFSFILANIKAKDPTTITDIEVLDAIQNLNTAQDAVSFLSALLGLSADNAKELVLSKINAGSDMIGMYLFGIAKNISIDKISQAMMSPTGKILREILQGNIFTGSKSYMRSSDAFSYFTEDGFNNIIRPYQEGVSAVNNYLKNVEGIGSIENLFNSFKEKNLKQLLDIFQNIREQELARKDGGYPSTLQLLRVIENYILNYKQTDPKKLYFLKELAFGANEFVRLGQFILNKELPNTPENVIKKVSDLENIVQDCEEQLAKRENRKPQPQPKLDITKAFFGNELEASIEAVEKVKLNINILDIISKVPHLKGYIKELVTLDNFYKERSYKYRSLREQIPILSRKYPALKTDYIQKRLSEFIQGSTISEWLKSTKQSFILPAGNYYFESDTGKLSDKPSTEDMVIPLGEDWANQTFRMFVERIIIPSLKNNSTIDNIIIKDLQPSSRDNTILGNKSLLYSLPINMIPAKGSLDDLKLSSYLNAFQSLKGYNYYYQVDLTKNNGESTVAMPITDILMLYSMFAHDWKNSKNSLVNLFKQEQLSYGNDGNPVINTLWDSFMVYEDSLDKSDASIEDYYNLNENLIPYLATKESPYTSNSQYIIYGTPQGNILLSKISNSELSQMDPEEQHKLYGEKYQKVNSSLDLGYFTSGRIMKRDKVINQEITLDYQNIDGKTKRIKAQIRVIYNGKNNKIEIFSNNIKDPDIRTKVNRTISLSELGLKEIPIKARIAKDGTFTKIPYVDMDLILKNIRNLYNPKTDC